MHAWEVGCSNQSVKKQINFLVHNFTINSSRFGVALYILFNIDCPYHFIQP